MPLTKADYAKFMGEMRNIDKLGLRNQDDIFSLNGGYFRVDCSGSIDNGWKLDIQDNMGKISGKPFRLSKSEPGSSVFAIVKLPKGVDSISGLDLAMLFERSMDAGIAVEMVPIKEQLTLKRK